LHPFFVREPGIWSVHTSLIVHFSASIQQVFNCHF